MQRGINHLIVRGTNPAAIFPACRIKGAGIFPSEARTGSRPSERKNARASLGTSTVLRTKARIHASASLRTTARRKTSNVKPRAAPLAKARTAKRFRVKGGTPSAVRSGRAQAIRKRSVPLIRRLRAVRGSRAAVVPRTSSIAYREGFRAGMKDGARLSGHEFSQKKALNRRWMLRTQAKRWVGKSWRRFSEASKGYVHGFFRAKKQVPPNWVLLPTAQSVAAIISIRNEERTIGLIMRELNRLPFDEVYVIVNGSEDGSFKQARERSDAVVLSFPEPLGHDVGRAMGAKLTDADILLFLDGDIVIPAEKLVPFIGGIERGLDLALNNITPFIRKFARRDQVTHMKQFLNASLGRSGLEANSLTAVPHALSRKAVNTLGITTLMVPPKAQALAIHHRLKIAAPGSVNVIRGNKRRTENTGRANPVADLIIGDHLEALKLSGDLSGERLSFIDNMRMRVHAGGEG